MYRLVFKGPCKCALQRSLQRQNGRQYSKNNRDSSGMPPNMREAGFGKVLLLFTPLAAVGGVIAYAKYNNEFRRMVEENVPGAESILKVALNEEPPFQGISKKFSEQIESVKSHFYNVNKSFDNETNKVTGLFDASEKKTTTSVKDESVNLEDVSGSQPPVKKSTNNGVKSAQEKPTQAAPPASPKKPETLPTDLVELEKAIEVSAALAVKEYNKAIRILKSFNEDVRNVVDRAIENVDSSLWTTLKNRTSARDTAVATAEKMARDALQKIEKCEIALSKAVNPRNTEHVEGVRKKIKKLFGHINAVKDELYREKDAATVSEKYWRNVEKARNYFIEEIESIFPGLNLSDKTLNISKEDLDLFILHAYSHVLALQKELQRLQTDGELRLKRAINAVRGTDDSDATRSQLDFLLETEKRRLALENQKKIFQIHAESDRQLRAQLKKQAEAHADHIKDIVNQRETELTRNFQRELDDKLAVEKANYKLQLAGMLGKLRGMDAALAARAEIERSANQAQALWAACQSLWASVRTVTPGVHYKYKLRPLKNEILAIYKVAAGDELVSTILQNLPHEVRERGVYPEDALRERFINVERIARRLALVPEDGASIPIYILSYLQSLFVLRPDNPISQDELDDKPFDYSKLDTYDILNRARYYVDRSDFLQALKYMNLLEGASRKISSDWVKETRIMLETQQAANTLMAHAAANGLFYL